MHSSTSFSIHISAVTVYYIVLVLITWQTMFPTAIVFAARCLCELVSHKTLAVPDIFSILL